MCSGLWSERESLKKMYGASFYNTVVDAWKYAAKGAGFSNRRDSFQQLLDKHHEYAAYLQWVLLEKKVE